MKTKLKQKQVTQSQELILDTNFFMKDNISKNDYKKHDKLNNKPFDTVDYIESHSRKYHLMYSH